MPPNGEDPRERSDEELAREIKGIQETLDAIFREGGDGDDELAARLNALRLEQQRRKTQATIERVRSGPRSPTPPDDPIGYGDMRRQGLEQWARRLGLPFGLPPNVDLYDDEIFNEIVADLYTYELLVREIERRQGAAGGERIAGMGSVERVIEALWRAIGSGRIDDAVAEQLRGMLSPEALKFLPLLVAISAGAGLLGGGWAVLVALLIAFGPAVWDFVDTMYAIITAETDEAFDQAVESLIRFLGGVGADILVALATYVAGRGMRWAIDRKRVSGTPSATTGGTAPAPGPRPRRARVDPPWLEPAPRIFETPLPPRPSGLSPMPRPGASAFDDPYNVRRFREEGREIIRGRLFGHRKGETSPEGRVIVEEKLTGAELERTGWHEAGHRRMRPYDVRDEARRGALGERVGRLLENSPLFKVLDEAFAEAHEMDTWDPHRLARRMHEIFERWRSESGRLKRRQYGVDLDRLERELTILVERHQDLARRLRNPRRLLRRRLDGSLDYDAFIRELEELYDTIQEVLGPAHD